MIKDPFLDAEYQPALRGLIGAFDIYDREETLGEELERYDVNASSDRKVLGRVYIADVSYYLTYRHKFMLVDLLIC